MFRRIDGFLISLIEGGCHRVQRLVGWTNYFFFGLANFLLVSLAVGAYFGLLPPTMIGEKGVLMNMVHGRNPGTFLVVLFSVYFFLTWRTEEKRSFDRMSKGVANPEKLHTFVFLLRVTVLLFVMVLQIFEWGYDTVFMVVLTLMYYLHACDPLPPCESRLEVWLKSFRGQPVLVPVPNKK